MSNNKITYRQVGDYLIPNIKLSAEDKNINIGIWGIHRKNYLMKNNHVLFGTMLTNGTLWQHLTEIDKRAEEMFSRLVDEIAKAEGVTEGLKATDQMVWMGKMNNIRQRVTEIVSNELIYT